MLTSISASSSSWTLILIPHASSSSFRIPWAYFSSQFVSSLRVRLALGKQENHLRWYRSCRVNYQISCPRVLFGSGLAIHCQTTSSEICLHKVGNPENIVRWWLSIGNECYMRPHISCTSCVWQSAHRKWHGWSFCRLWQPSKIMNFQGSLCLQSGSAIHGVFWGFVHIKEFCNPWAKCSNSLVREFGSNFMTSSREACDPWAQSLGFAKDLIFVRLAQVMVSSNLQSMGVMPAFSWGFRRICHTKTL